MLQTGDTVGPRYTAPKISAISYLFRTFSLLIMGDTERPRYTGFRGLSVRGITALQCIYPFNMPWASVRAHGYKKKIIFREGNQKSPTYGHVTKLFLESEFQHKRNKQTKKRKFSAKSCSFLGSNRFKE